MQTAFPQSGKYLRSGTHPPSLITSSTIPCLAPLVKQFLKQFQAQLSPICLHKSNPRAFDNLRRRS